MMTQEKLKSRSSVVTINAVVSLSSFVSVAVASTNVLAAVNSSSLAVPLGSSCASAAVVSPSVSVTLIPTDNASVGSSK